MGRSSGQLGIDVGVASRDDLRAWGKIVGFGPGVAAGRRRCKT